MIRATVVGVTGYTGFEILRVLLKHKNCRVAGVTAKRIESPTPVATLFPQLAHLTDLVCQNEINIEKIAKDSDIVFLSLPHKVSMSYAGLFLKKGIKVIDLSADYRLPDPKLYEKFYGVPHEDVSNLSRAAYGLPEWYAERIRKADLVANPGCYPTSVLLAVLPLLKDGLVDQAFPIISDSKSGVSGAGRNPAQALHFPECNESFKAYKVANHQHTPEMERIMTEISLKNHKFIFVPHLIPISRGILSTIYVPLKGDVSDENIRNSYQQAYRGAAFVRLCSPGMMPEIRYVNYTNFCDIGWVSKERVLIVVSAIDNLLKGAAGQAVQNMNIMFGLEEREALWESSDASKS